MDKSKGRRDGRAESKGETEEPTGIVDDSITTEGGREEEGDEEKVKGNSNDEKRKIRS